MKKTMCIIYYAVMALPIPISLVSWIGTLISVANIGATKIGGILDVINVIVALLSMLLAGIYLISYVYSLYRTVKVGKLTFAFFLPILHIAVTAVSIWTWSLFD